MSALDERLAVRASPLTHVPERAGATSLRMPGAAEYAGDAPMNMPAKRPCESLCGGPA